MCPTRELRRPPRRLYEEKSTISLRCYRIRATTLRLALRIIRQPSDAADRDAAASTWRLEKTGRASTTRSRTGLERSPRKTRPMRSTHSRALLYGHVTLSFCLKTAYRVNVWVQTDCYSTSESCFMSQLTRILNVFFAPLPLNHVYFLKTIIYNCGRGVLQRGHMPGRTEGSTHGRTTRKHNTSGEEVKV